MKKFFLLAIAAVAAVGVYAQDIIVTRDAKRVEAKILEVSSSEIKYKEFNNLEGPTFVLSAAEINTIIYQNGTVKVFDQPKQAAAAAYSVSQANYAAAGNAVPQASGMPITKKDKLYYLGDQSMNEEQYVAFVQQNCQQAYDRYMSGKKLRKSGWSMFASGLTFIVCGSVLVGVGTGLTVDNIRSGGSFKANPWEDPLYAGLCAPGAILLGVGSGLFLGSIPCIVVGTVRRNNSHEIYNETCARSTADVIEFGIQPAANGIGLAMRF